MSNREQFKTNLLQLLTLLFILRKINTTKILQKNGKSRQTNWIESTEIEDANEVKHWLERGEMANFIVSSINTWIK